QRVVCSYIVKASVSRTNKVEDTRVRDPESAMPMRIEEVLETKRFPGHRDPSLNKEVKLER
ncbi:hypothetical protein ACERII_03905, partial [Evansella sp. AB-rgal1]|uniref:hypothetical protein n=1 Tax=Evansella sp. AB-rgal1 TaxID=3242696 RepID=UPI00359EF6A5